MINLKQKAAMFGLDARIALAIFGALSVISGATLYNVIQQAKITTFATELQEIGKAYEQYYLDVGEHLEISQYQGCCLEKDEIITSTKVGWKGPYFSFDRDRVGRHFAQHKTPDKNIITVIFKKLSASGGVCSTSNCYVWVEFYSGVNIRTAKAVKKYFDRTDDITHNGIIRTKVEGSDDNVSIMYRALPF